MLLKKTENPKRTKIGKGQLLLENSRVITFIYLKNRLVQQNFHLQQNAFIIIIDILFTDLLYLLYLVVIVENKNEK